MTAYTGNCSILLTNLPLLDPAGRGPKRGLRGGRVLVAVRHPDAAGRRCHAFIRAIQDAGVQLTGLNFAAGDMPAGDRGILSNPALDAGVPRQCPRSPSVSPRRSDPRLQRALRNPSTILARDPGHVGTDNLRVRRTRADRIGATVLVETRQRRTAISAHHGR